jgi:hypothetical protein
VSLRFHCKFSTYITKHIRVVRKFSRYCEDQLQHKIAFKLTQTMNKEHWPPPLHVIKWNSKHGGNEIVERRRARYISIPTSNRIKPVSYCSCSRADFKHVWHITVPSVLWINSWWWAEELPETCRVSCRSKFGKLVHLVGFIVK